MKVALIAGTGFVGSYITDELIAHDMIPRLLVRQGAESKKDVNWFLAISLTISAAP